MWSLLVRSSRGYSIVKGQTCLSSEVHKCIGQGVKNALIFFYKSRLPKCRVFGSGKKGRQEEPLGQKCRHLGQVNMLLFLTQC